MRKTFILILLNFVLMQDLYAESKILDIRVYQEKSVLYTDVNSFIPSTTAPLNAVKNGIQLNLKYIFKLQEDKWYVTKPYITIEKNYTIYFDKISNQYVLLNPITFKKESFLSFDTLIFNVERLEHFPIVNLSLIKPDTKASVELILDTKSIPSSLMLDIYFDDDWKLDSKKVYFNILKSNKY